MTDNIIIFPKDKVIQEEDNIVSKEYILKQKEQIILQANASIGLSKYYEYIMHRIDDSCEHGNNIVPEGLEEIDDEDVVCCNCIDNTEGRNQNFFKIKEEIKKAPSVN